MTKILENTFRAVNIGLVNETAIIAERLGVDVWEVIDAAATKPFGFMKFTPGPGLGGHCIPVDPHYLSWKMRTLNYKTRFIELASEINSEMPVFVVDQIRDALNRNRKAVNGAKVLVLGVAYKRDIEDVRESPALDVIRLLEADGARGLVSRSVRARAARRGSGPGVGRAHRRGLVRRGRGRDPHRPHGVRLPAGGRRIARCSSTRGTRRRGRGWRSGPAGS